MTAASKTTSDLFEEEVGEEDRDRENKLVSAKLKLRVFQLPETEISNRFPANASVLEKHGTFLRFVHVLTCFKMRWIVEKSAGISFQEKRINSQKLNFTNERQKV